MYASSDEGRKKRVLLGGQYAHKFLYEYLKHFYNVSVFAGMQSIQNGTVFDYAVIDNIVIEQTNGNVIKGLIDRNPNIQIVVRDVAYRDWTPQVYDAEGLKKLAATNSNITFPKNSDISDVVFDVLEEFEKNNIWGGKYG